MTKEEFETLMLNDSMTVEDYERDYLADDVRRFYNLRSCVDWLSMDLDKMTVRALLNWEAYRTARKHVDAIKRAMHDENVQFNFLRHVRKGDMDAVRACFKDEKQASTLIGASKRLSQYQAYKSVSVQEIMALADEMAFARDLEKADPKRFKAWCETHPGVDIHANDDAGEDQAGN